MAPPKVHLNIKELGIPSLTTFVHKLANGVARSMVTTTVHMWDTQKKRSKVIARETVGRIENGAPFGRIAFKPSFIERYPILKEGVAENDEVIIAQMSSAEISDKASSVRGPRRF